MSDAKHWERVYSSRPPDEVGWYTPRLATSLAWIDELNLGPEDAVIDVGGGASTLVDDLLQSGTGDLTVLDLSGAAFSRAQERLGKAAAGVRWRIGDVTGIDLPSGRYSLWHDRAVFHFLVEPELQRRYREKLLGALRTGGHFIIGAFTLEAPPRCSGLPVRRYDAEGLSAFFGDSLELKRRKYEMHVTPGGVEQAYVYCLFQKVA